MPRGTEAVLLEAGFEDWFEDWSNTPDKFPVFNLGNTQLKAVNFELEICNQVSVIY